MLSEVTLVFESAKAKNEFLVGLCDGWGESLGLLLEWGGGNLQDAARVTVLKGLHSDEEPEHEFGEGIFDADDELNDILERADEFRG